MKISDQIVTAVTTVYEPVGQLILWPGRDGIQSETLAEAGYITYVGSEPIRFHADLEHAQQYHERMIDAYRERNYT